MVLSQRVLSSARLFQRSLTTTRSRFVKGVNLEAYAPELRKIKKRQMEFAIDNGLRVHERGGQGDKLGYIITSAVMALGFFEFCRVVWTLAYPEWHTFLSMNKDKSVE